MKQIWGEKVMKLKEISNLFNEIDYFKGIYNKDDYFQEFIYLYGERELLMKVEALYNTGGVSSVGKLFTLKTNKWVELSSIDNKIKTIEITDKTVTNTGTKINKGGKTRQTNSNNTNEVIPFDVVESIQNEKDINTIEEVESNSDDLTTENKVVYSGFSKEKIDYFIKKFENYSEYRYTIYSDIINMLTLQIY